MVRLSTGRAMTRPGARRTAPHLDRATPVHPARSRRTFVSMTRMSAERAGAWARARRGLAPVVTVLVALLGTVALSVPSDTAAACDELRIPSLDLSRCVVPGSQDEIDDGNVVRVDYLSSPTVHWLAGHHTSHGATFSVLTGLRIGATVRYRGQTYVVTEYRLVDRFHPDPVMGWMSSDHASVVLQTSASGVYVHVWRSVALVPAVPVVATAAPPVPVP